MDEGMTPFGDQGWREPMMMDDGALRCGECGAKVTSVSRGRQVREDGTLGPPEPAKFGCGHLAGEFGRLLRVDLLASAPGPVAYWPEGLGEQGIATLRGHYDRPDEGDDRG